MSGHAGGKGPRTQRRATPKTPTARSRTAIRIALVAAAALAACAAGVAGVNWSALTANNAAVDSFNATAASYAKEDADLQALRNAQRQTDALFEDATATEALQLPPVRDMIESNAERSRQLSAQLDKDLDDDGQDRSDADPSKGGSGGSDGDSSQSDADRIDKVLKQNSKQLDLHNLPSDTSQNGDSSQSDAKPW